MTPPKSQIQRALDRAVNLNAEASVLGGIMFRNDLLPQLDTLHADDFYSPKHQAVYSAICNLEAEHGCDSGAIDTVTIENELLRMGKLEAVGGLAFISDLAMHVPSCDNVLEYARIVRQHRTTRDVIQAAGHIVDRVAEDGDTSGDQAVELAFTTFQKIEVGATEDRGKAMGSHIDDAYRGIMNDLASLERGEKIMPGMPTGISAIDRNMGGTPFSVLSMIGARPSGGKTTVAMKLTTSAMTLGDDDPLFFSYEDNGISFANRRLASASGVPTNRIIARNFEGDDMRRLGKAYAAIRSSPDVLVMAAGMQVEDLARYVRAYRRRRSGKLGLSRTRGRLIVVDYIQKMPMNPEFRGKRNEAIGHITRTLSWLAQEESQVAGNEVAIVGLSQLGREVDKRDDPTPQLGDFKDSGDIEQDCKMAIGLIYWHGYDKDRDPNLLEAHIIKNHNGPKGKVVPLHWDLATHTISDDAGGVEISRHRARWGGRPDELYAENDE